MAKKADKDPYKFESHKFYQSTTCGKHVCWQCGLIALRNKATDWCIEKGCIVLPEYMYSPQYSTVLDIESNVGMFGGMQIANEYRDLETGNVIHHYSQYDKDLITAIKALRLKEA